MLRVAAVGIVADGLPEERRRGSEARGIPVRIGQVLLSCCRRNLRKMAEPSLTRMAVGGVPETARDREERVVTGKDLRDLTPVPRAPEASLEAGAKLPERPD